MCNKANETALKLKKKSPNNQVIKNIQQNTRVNLAHPKFGIVCAEIMEPCTVTQLSHKNLQYLFICMDAIVQHRFRRWQEAVSLKKLYMVQRNLFSTN